MTRVLNRLGWLFLLPAVLLSGACSTGNRRDLPPTPMQTAQQQFPEEELLDVGIEIFGAGETNEQELAEQHSNPEIRKSETHFFPVHLKRTLERTGYWGDVRVLPVATVGHDVTVRGRVIQSNGERLKIRIRVEDAQGYVWFTRNYQAKATRDAYKQAKEGTLDPFQRVYASIANDMAAFRRTLTSVELKQLQRTSDLLFAANLVPEAFGEFTESNEKGITRVVRLPAASDPMWTRVRNVMSRNAMFVDTLNAYYDPYYQGMWKGYLDWRKMNLVEMAGLRKARGDGFKQAAAGVAMIVAAILLELNDVDNVSTIRDVLVIGGSQVIVGGINVSKQADMHSAALEELSESFGSEMEVVVLDLEGETVELTGTVEEQFEQWKELLVKIYWRENGGMPPVEADPES